MELKALRERECEGETERGGATMRGKKSGECGVNRSALRTEEHTSTAFLRTDVAGMKTKKKREKKSSELL